MTQPTEVEAASVTQSHLPNDAHIGGAHLRVSDLDEALAFYQGVLDFTLAERDEHTIALAPSAGEAPILRLTEQPGAQRKPQRSTGLYHIAILMPSRPALGQILRRMLTRRYPIGGASDHLVSEALYLSDPDGNGLEIYRDRPRSEWRMDGQQVAMATEALDVEGVLGEADESSDAGIVSGTVMGHIHLHVADLNRAEKFYGGLLGFDVVQRGYPGALFMSAGGYHHHLGLNTWAGKTPPPANAVGLESFTVTIPDPAGWAQAVERTGALVAGSSASVRDPEGNTVILAKS